MTDPGDNKSTDKKPDKFLGPKCHIYVLSCESGKYYVGKVEVIANEEDKITVKRRFEGHKIDKGSEFTKNYKPKEIVQIIPNVSSFMETAITLQYMSEHGINNVRGGTLSNLVLSQVDLEHIDREMKEAQNKCRICAGDHFVNKCPTKDKNTPGEEGIIATYQLNENEITLLIPFNQNTRKLAKDLRMYGFEHNNDIWFKAFKNPGDAGVIILYGIDQLLILSNLVKMIK